MSRLTFRIARWCALLLLIIEHNSRSACAWTVGTRASGITRTRRRVQPRDARDAVLSRFPSSVPQQRAAAVKSDHDDVSSNPDDSEAIKAAPLTGVDDVTGVTLKIAVDSMGNAADLSAEISERFTCDASLDMVHRLRAASDAVLVGRGTVAADDPSLTVRRGVACDEQPLRVVLDPRLSLLTEEDESAQERGSSKRYRLFDDGERTIVYHCVKDVDTSSLNLLETVACVYLPSIPQQPTGTTQSSLPQTSRLRKGEYFLSARDVVEDLRRRCGVRHLMVEGGPVTARLFLTSPCGACSGNDDENESAESSVVDRVILVKAPLCFRKPLASGISAALLERVGFRRLGTAPSGVDEIEYWVNGEKDVRWPSTRLEDWP